MTHSQDENSETLAALDGWDDQRQQPTHSDEFPLYDPAFEHDACGVGFVARVSGSPDHEVLRLALESVTNLSHRGAVDADGRTGDGAGVLTQLPRALFARELESMGKGGASVADLAVAMVFLPRREETAVVARGLLEIAASELGVETVGWRKVPVDPSCLGAKAKGTQPRIEQLLLLKPAGLSALEFERLLYRVRKRAERAAAERGMRSFYVPSLSYRTIVYKGLFVAPQLPLFYPDLRDPLYETSIAVYHQRYSTNTFPNWSLAQPFRFLAHNGEINTLQGNRNWMRARQADLASPVWGDAIRDLKPVVWEAGSDSASLDNVLELLELSGRSAVHSLMMLVPEAWENVADLSPERRAFLHYHAGLVEPWDGPAALAFTDGMTVGAALDRNGLRPLRYKITTDGLVLAGSEVGSVDVDDAIVTEKGRLGPGQILVVDTERGLVLHDEEAKEAVAGDQPYLEWLERQVRYAPDWHGTTGIAHQPDPQEANPHLYQLHGNASLTQRQLAFGFNSEELKFVVEPMAVEGKEPTWSMGDDAPLAILSRQPRPLMAYFRQRFAQVTNPPIDPLRESLVMSLRTYLGARASLLEETEQHARLVNLPSPILEESETAWLRGQHEQGFPSATVDALFPASSGPDGLRSAIEDLQLAAERAVDSGATILFISDRKVDAEHAPIPMLLAAGAVHHHLIRIGKRMRAEIVVETGELWELQQLALLIGFGVGAVCPYLAWQTASNLAEESGADPAIARKLYRKSLEAGLLKIMSKMGISAVSSYRGAQIFEAMGLGDEVIQLAFVGTPSRVGGIGLVELATETLRRHYEAFGEQTPTKLKDYGHYRFRRDGEYHGYNPFVVRSLQNSVRTGRYEDYSVFADMVHHRPTVNLRDLLEVSALGPSIDIEEVESAESIRSRFTAQAMSLGALSPEAHQTIAIAMNRIGGRSNTGEGGEDPGYYRHRTDGDSPDNKIKQIASARFGVTAEYLAHATEIEIKMAQGSKPGEGGQLPAHKVSSLIARFRRTIPGIPLISPPPHHDIYSIEDLAQLIYDLKQVNPRARVGVKLVSEAGVGTVAAGVAKAGADYVLISGQDGGTGASPLSSIKHAGCPWELGLAETQQVLVLNDLRGRVTLRVDGGFKTGKDVIMGALLGAEEYGFATGVVVSIGCDMARQCHLNTCPTGIATQREDLRKKFEGTPDMLINYMSFVAREVRESLAKMGVRRIDDIVGRSDLLTQISPEQDDRRRAWRGIDLGAITTTSAVGHRPVRNLTSQAKPVGVLNERIVADAANAVQTGEPVNLYYDIRSCDRTIGSTLAGQICHLHGGEGLADGTVSIDFNGSAGQSFGAWAAPGMTLKLVGEANDYVGKGLCGGTIIIRPPARASYNWQEQVIAGNTVLYGATGGALFLAGRAGERFAVRNSGALGVCEGIGDHGCEYMTAGTVVVLGPTGRNFAAGMSAGIAYVLDETGDFPERCNTEMVSLERICDEQDGDVLLSALRRHLEATDSARAAAILADWPAYSRSFWKIVPHPPVETAQSGTVLATKRGAERN